MSTVGTRSYPRRTGLASEPALKFRVNSPLAVSEGLRDVVELDLIRLPSVFGGPGE